MRSVTGYSTGVPAAIGSRKTISDHGRWDGRVGLYAGFCARTRGAATVIYLRLPLPTASSGLPAGSGGPPSNACAGPGKPGPS